MEGSRWLWYSLSHSILPVLFLKSSNWFFESSAANKQNSEEEIKHICGLGASVGYERVERVFNTPRLKSQICFISSSLFVSFVSLADPTNQKLFFVSQQLMLEIKQLLRQIHINRLWIHQSSILIPQRIQLLLAVCLDLHSRWRSVNTLSI